MPDPQPSAVAKWLALCAIRCVMRANVADEMSDKILGVSVNDIAIALDDAGVRKAVEFLGWANADMKLNDKAFYDSNYEAAAEESDHAWSNIMAALAALTGDDVAT